MKNSKGSYLRVEKKFKGSYLWSNHSLSNTHYLTLTIKHSLSNTHYQSKIPLQKYLFTTSSSQPPLHNIIFTTTSSKLPLQLYMLSHQANLLNQISSKYLFKNIPLSSSKSQSTETNILKQISSTDFEFISERLIM